jgi:hypothetical protein
MVSFCSDPLSHHTFVLPLHFHLVGKLVGAAAAVVVVAAAVVVAFAVVLAAVAAVEVVVSAVVGVAVS